jgi:hypothetical protein
MSHMNIRERLEEIIVEHDSKFKKRAKQLAEDEFIKKTWDDIRSFNETGVKKQLIDAIKATLAYESFDAEINLITTSDLLIIQLLNVRDVHEQGEFRFANIIDTSMNENDFKYYLLNDKFPEALVTVIIDGLIESTIVDDDV